MTSYMRCAISLLLIPMCLFGQGLPHSHGGSDIGEPADHAVRPHVHLHASRPHHDHGNGVAHDHHHANAGKHHSHHRGAKKPLKAPAFMAETDHDADAFYLEVTVPSTARKAQVKSAVASQYTDSGNSHRPGPVAVLGVSGHSGAAPPGYYPVLPILLRTSSLRI